MGIATDAGGNHSQTTCNRQALSVLEPDMGVLQPMLMSDADSSSAIYIAIAAKYCNMSVLDRDNVSLN